MTLSPFLKMMKTPIYDFLEAYREKEGSRLHMPGHKGKTFLGPEPFDITEIEGADVLYHAEGIIAESEANATHLFGSAHTFYSAEGSSLTIKAMLALVTAGKDKPLVLAGRNAHKAFLYAAAWLDFEILWLYPENTASISSCPLTAEEIEKAIDSADRKPAAVYLTSPDYLGGLADIEQIGKVCEEKNIPLLVDNAHGAYLAFCKENRHPIALGATMCCDSAHKTLPVLTGGAYLHIGKNGRRYLPMARQMLSAFASTSPSYLILASLDLANRYLADDYRERLALTISALDDLKKRAEDFGFTVPASDPLRLTVHTSQSGITGHRFAEILRRHQVEPEYVDGDYAVMMFTPENDAVDYRRVLSALRVAARERKDTPLSPAPLCPPLPTALPPRQALLSPMEFVPVAESVGRIAAAPTVSCPPAIPIAVSGEVITAEAVALFKHHGMETVAVVWKAR